ncbi:ribosomal protein S18-alanine N-acetyltransferase [Curtobacterium sp. MCPF17_002]|uniref:ribosomal protein S18-alanine N-acetyltransferase n=1 Tax=Curtobacterium sp. MCPF17_002 TaxID=2175645 RepID=UPI000DA89D52|nr:ribosomal protein S18-alanine N-acetyltransferase [Curtobacterium sp. MCPF17_002]WIB77250.1 ribosomal protein S18-alanine N-acetyltransferase [Curtobacterium sp. MCPF17_002]
MTLPDGLRLRRAHPHDLDEVMWLEHASFPTDAWSASQMSGELYSPHGYYIVVETTGDGAPTVVGAPSIVGYAGLSSLSGNPVADVQTIAVAADQRGKGIGRVLFTELLDEAARRGVHEVFLEVRADNPVAQAMYTAFGFERIAVRPRYYQPDGVDAWVMRAELARRATDGPGPIGQETLDERD